MSTERRDCSWWILPRMDSAKALWQFCLAWLALFVHVWTSSRTAPPETPARLATNSLNSVCRNSTIVRLLLMDLRRGSPPLGGRFSTAAGTSASRTLSLLAHPISARTERFHPVLP
jgi:hypothetical protein